MPVARSQESDSRATILLLGGDFSGATGALAVALERRGYDVVRRAPSLRQLRTRPLHLAAILVESILRYGHRFRSYAARTAAAERAYAIACEAIASELPRLDWVIQMGGDHATYSSRRRPGTVYSLSTDHTNMLSKQGPDHGFEAPERRSHKSWHAVERRIMHMQDCNFVWGSQVRKSMLEDYEVPPERVLVVGAGPSWDADIARDRPHKRWDGKNVLFVGLDAPRKGLSTLLEAFALVRGVHPDARLDVVGVHGTSADGVRYHGRLSGAPLRDLFYDAQVFAMPTLREPFGLVFVEAMWSKAACVGTDIGAIPEIIRDGETGFIVPPNDARALAGRINQLFDDPELLRRLGENGYADARSRWNWEVVVESMIARAASLGFRR
jgi:glycosyltransferase involved in cell wall biosynthesis